MKYCPYCGASLLGDAVSFCSECGKELPGAGSPAKNKVQKPLKTKKKTKDDTLPRLDRRKSTSAPKIIEEQVIHESKRDKDYDGYYDDILPPDADRQREGLDRELLKKIGAVAIGVVLIIGLCVAAMYLL